MYPPGRAFHVVASATEHFEAGLGNIRQLAGMMLHHGETLDRDRRHDFLRTIEEKAEQLLEVTAHLGDFAQLTLGQKPAGRTKLVLSEVAIQAMDALTPLATSTRRLLVLAQSAGEPPIAGDYRKLLNVLCSVLRHCIQIAVPAAQILLSTRSGPREVRLEIDVPVGPEFPPLAPATLPRGDAPVAAGSGLAMAVIAHILSLYGGRLDTLASESHQRFIIALPLAAG